MRRRRFGGCLRASRLDHDDRFGQRHLARRRQKCPRVADGLHVQHDAGRLGIVAEVVDEIAPAHVEHRPNRHEGAEADVGLKAPIEDGRAECAALTDEADMTDSRSLRREGRVQTSRGTHDAQAVGTNDPHGAAARLLEDPLLERGAAGALLFESGGDHDRRRYARLDTFAHDGRHGRGRRHDHRQIYGTGHGGNGGVCRNPQHVCAMRIHRKHRPAEGRRRQIRHHRQADAAWRVGGANDGDAARREERPERRVEPQDVTGRLRCGRHAMRLAARGERPRRAGTAP